MKSLLILVLLVSFACQKKNSPPKKDDVRSDFVTDTNGAGRHYGDYILDEDDHEVSIMAHTGFQAYNAVPWKNGEIPVSFKSSVSKARQAVFFNACLEWSKAANVKCRQKRLLEKNYVYITDEKPKECWTNLGAGAKSGKRTFNYGTEGCWGPPAIIHEIGHMLGLMHEHQRPDRDLYIDVFAENAGAFAYAFDKLSVGSLDNAGPYDFASIMHYWNASHSINGKPILVPKKGYEQFASVMGRSKTLTAGDRALIARIYGPPKP